MSRLYDRIMRDRLVSPVIKLALDGAQVILADNVARYYYGDRQEEYQQSGIDSVLVSVNDLPCLAPPFPKFFIEMSFRFANDVREPLMTLGFLFQSTQEYDKYFDQAKFMDEPHWIMLCDLFIAGLPYTSHYQWLVGLDTQGQLLKTQDGKIHFPPGGPTKRGQVVRLGEDEVISSLGKQISIPLMAIALMHCRNVELVDEVPPPKLSKSHEKKYGVPLVKFKTLKVHSMRREYTDDDRESQPGIPKSLHICRGHFKDYRNGGGLFGKYEGIYWWDQHVRGDIKRGVTIKDYDVQAPSEN